MKKTYCVYLDESGDFNNDLNVSWKNECLVGGYLVEEDKLPDHWVVYRMLIDAYKTVHPDTDRSDAEIYELMKHATELSADKARLSSEILTPLSHKVDFVIFENYNKSSILNSSLTYLNIMVDGIMQLLTRLIMENNGDKVVLNVTAGKRVDTALNEATDNQVYEYIPLEEYTDRIKERLILEKIKRPMIYNSRSEIHITCENDKQDHYLVAADYVCNFYITRTANAFKTEYEPGVSYRRYLEALYDESNIFHLNGNLERERVLNYMDSQSFDAALFDICVGTIKNKKNIDSIINMVNTLREKQVQNILRGVSSYMDNVVAVQRDISDDVLHYLERAEQIGQKIAEAGHDVNIYAMDMILYKMAVYNHRGDFIQVEKLFNDCKSILQKTISHAENVDYAYMLYNRYAVYLYDIFEFEKGYELLKKLVKNFEAYELILSDLPDMENEDGRFYADQLGKILGTQAQYARTHLKNGLINYDKAIEISDKAIENFLMDSDKERQYQYRAQIEAEAGHFEEALRFYCKGFCLAKWEDIFKTENVRNIFGMYHLSFILDKMSKDETNKDVVKKIISKFRDNEKVIFDYDDFPGFLITFKIAKTMVRVDMNPSMIQKYFKQSLMLEAKEDITPLYQIFMTMIHAEYLGWMLDRGQDIKEEMNKVQDILQGLKKMSFTGEIKTNLDKLAKVLQSTNSADFYGYSELLQY